jgi:malate/lactate dehydrogenase
MNASLIETIVSQVCIYSPHATLIIFTQPNELMTYVASCVSKFPIERIFGLGTSVNTAYVHRAILDRTEKIHGRVNGFFVLGDSCSTILTHHLTIDGICCSDIYSKSIINKVEKPTTENESMSTKGNLQDWDLIMLLKNKENVYSNTRRRLPIVTDLISRQKIAMKYLLSNSTTPDTETKLQESIQIPFSTKSRSNWTEAMLIVHITRALINGHEFQSNFAVNISPIHNSKNVFINYPTIIGSSNRSIEYILPFHHGQNILNQRSFLIPYEKLQTKIRLSKSKD